MNTKTLLKYYRSYKVNISKDSNFRLRDYL